MMQIFIDVFNNREKALIIWIVIALVYMLLNKDIRKSFMLVVKAILSKKIAIALAAMLIYISSIVFAAYKVHFWDSSLLKDTVFWIIGTAFVMFINFDKANKDGNYFKKVLVDSLKFVILLEFIINLYVFPFFVELILIPILFFLTAMLVISGTKKEFYPVKKILQTLLAIFGLYLIFYAVTHIFGNFKEFATIENLKDFLLTPLLTLLFLPFIYFLALYSAYELLFVRLDLLMKHNHKRLRQFTKREIFNACLFDLKKLNRFSANSAKQLMSIKNKMDVVRLINGERNE
ncbi:MAG: hypothetical protein ACREHC_00350 [Candidatus Levyibacteriota bacterium]